METLEKTFLGLIKGGLYGLQPQIVPNLSDEDWERLLHLAQKHGVTGLLVQGVELLPEQTYIPQQLVFELLSAEQRIIRANRQIQAAGKSLANFFFHKSLTDPTFVKGPLLAAFYKKPLLRECGDLDIYLKGDSFDRACTLLASKGIRVHHSPDGSVQYPWEGVMIDQHRRYYDLHVSPLKLPPVPSPEATLVMLSAHILKHAMGPGVGLRQICDMVMASRALEGTYQKVRLLGYYRECGLLTWNHMLSSFMSLYLDFDDGLFSDLSDKEALRLMRIVRNGNFGHFSKGRQKALKGHLRRMDTALRFVRRLPFSLKYAPAELVYTIKELIHL